MKEVEIVHSFRKANNSDASLGETNMVKFKNLNQKKTAPISNTSAIAAPLFSQVPPQIVDLIVELAEAIMRVDLNLPETLLLDKHKGKELMAGTSKRSKKK